MTAHSISLGIGATIHAELRAMQHEIRTLTSLRFVAAFWIFIFHANIRWPLGLPTSVDTLVMHGGVGMSLFFILSGFVLGLTYKGGVTNARQYMLRRFARIYPVYVLAAIVSLPWFRLDFTGWAAVAQASYIVFLNIVMLQGWFPTLFQYWNNNASWSLSVEAFFYSLFPKLIEVIQFYSNTRIIKMIFILYLLASIPGLSYFAIPNSPFIFYILPIFRLPEFVIGVSIAVLFNRGHRLPLPGTITLCTVTFFATCLLHVTPGMYVSSNFFAVPCIALLIMACAQMRIPGLESGPFVAMGRASYAFYMLQPAVILTVAAAPKPSFLGHWPLSIIAFLILSGLSLGTFRWYERPIRNWLIGRRRVIRSDAAVANA